MSVQKVVANKIHHGLLGSGASCCNRSKSAKEIAWVLSHLPVPQEVPVHPDDHSLGPRYQPETPQPPNLKSRT